jgi:hypothetical protein
MDAGGHRCAVTKATLGTEIFLATEGTQMEHRLDREKHFDTNYTDLDGLNGQAGKILDRINRIYRINWMGQIIL